MCWYGMWLVICSGSIWKTTKVHQPKTCCLTTHHNYTIHCHTETQNPLPDCKIFKLTKNVSPQHFMSLSPIPTTPEQPHQQRYMPSFTLHVTFLRKLWSYCVSSPSKDHVYHNTFIVYILHCIYVLLHCTYATATSIQKEIFCCEIHKVIKSIWFPFSSGSCFNHMQHFARFDFQDLQFELYRVGSGFREI